MPALVVACHRASITTALAVAVASLVAGQLVRPGVADAATVGAIGSGPEAAARILANASASGPITVDAQIVHDGRASVETIPASDRASALAVIERAGSLAGVQAVGISAPVGVAGSGVAGSGGTGDSVGVARYDDPGRARQWAMDALHAEAVNEAVAAAGGDTSSITIAVVDTGVDATHPDFARGTVLKGVDLVGDGLDPAGFGDVDPDGHGTHVAGIIAAARSNGRDIAGLTDAKILPVRVMDAYGHGTSANVAAGIDWAVNHGADIINVSLAGPYDPVYDAAAAYARAHDVIVVAAAGNDAMTGDAEQWPAGSPGVLAVAATDSAGKVAPFSTHGPQVRIAAPGVAILSLCSDQIDPARASCPPGGERIMSGTSQATPYVSASAALAWAVHPDLTADQIVALLTSTASDLSAAGTNRVSSLDSTYDGAGLVDPYRAVTGHDPCSGAECGPQPGTSTSGFGVARVAGKTRVATAISVSSATYADGAAGAVVVARDDDYADALAGTPLAVATRAPLLMTPPSRLDAGVAAEIRRVLPAGRTVYVLGGPASVSPAVTSALTAMGYAVDRLAGADRYATAAAVAAALGNPTTAFLATGTSYADSLSAGDAASVAGGVLLLTDGDHLPAATAAYLAAHPGATYAIGGPASRADPDAVAVTGPDRYATAAAVATRFFPAAKQVGLVDGGSYADALAAGPQLALAHAPLLLTAPGDLPSCVTRWLDSADVVSATVYGGVAGVSAAVERQVGSVIEAQLSWNHAS